MHSCVRVCLGFRGGSEEKSGSEMGVCSLRSLRIGAGRMYTRARRELGWIFPFIPRGSLLWSSAAFAEGYEMMTWKVQEVELG
jgi:hypothetical protein